ncbi:Leucine-responsive regulatory protein [Salmonella enterica subsp. enterica serovar Typhisuis]|nr:Leucine-responsive regulatory protein [Salmonella enterica subsp. enterica serovar Typhisuis]
MTEYLDDKDKELLKEIQKDCAQTLWQLAYKVGLTPTPCFKRLKKLKDRGGSLVSSLYWIKKN